MADIKSQSIWQGHYGIKQLCDTTGCWWAVDKLLTRKTDLKEWWRCRLLGVCLLVGSLSRLPGHSTAGCCWAGPSLQQGPQGTRSSQRSKWMPETSPSCPLDLCWALALLELLWLKIKCICRDSYGQYKPFRLLVMRVGIDQSDGVCVKKECRTGFPAGQLCVVSLDAGLSECIYCQARSRPNSVCYQADLSASVCDKSGPVRLCGECGYQPVRLCGECGYQPVRPCSECGYHPLRLCGECEYQPVRLCGECGYQPLRLCGECGYHPLRLCSECGYHPLRLCGECVDINH